MNEILFEVLKAVLVLVIILIGRYAIPYIRLQLENTKYAWVLKWVDLAVKSAEQTITGERTGPEKKAIVTEFIKNMLIKKNIAMSEDQVDTLIEAAVFAMKNG